MSKPVDYNIILDVNVDDVNGVNFTLVDDLDIVSYKFDVLGKIPGLKPAKAQLTHVVGLDSSTHIILGDIEIDYDIILGDDEKPEPPEESNDIILDGNTLILPSLSFQEWDDLSLRFDRSAPREPKELNANFAFGSTLKYFLTKPVSTSINVGDLNLCPKGRLGLLIGKEGCGTGDPKALSADFVFGSVAEAKIERVKSLSADFSFDVVFKYDSNWVGDLVLCPGSSNELVIGGSGCQPPSIYSVFHFGSTAKYGLFEFGERNNDVEMYFGSTAKVSFSSQIKSSPTFGVTAEATITRQKNWGTTFYFGSTIEVEYERRPTVGGELEFGSAAEYRFAAHPEIGGELEFGSAAEYIIANPPALLAAKFSFGVWTNVPFYDLLDIDLIRTRTDCFDLPTYPDVSLDIDLADEWIDYSIDSDLWVVSSCNITYRKHLPDIIMAFGAEAIEAPKTYLSSFDCVIGATIDVDGLYQYNPLFNLCPDAFVENGEKVIIDYNETMGTCGSWKFEFGASTTAGKITEQKGIPANFYYGVDIENKPDIARWQYKFEYGVEARAGIGRSWRLKYDAAFGVEPEYEFTMPWKEMYFGASCEYTLVFTYNIEFLEDGCLDNEFIPVDEDGVIMQDKIRKQAMEGDKYVHVIKARIYH